MTEEMLQEILEAFQLYKEADIFCAIWIVVSFFGCIAALIVYSVISKKRDLRIKQWRAEYKATLTEEQLKAIEQYNKIK